MKTYSPAVDLVNVAWWMAKMEEDSDGEWVHLEDHLAVVAENALKVKARDVEIERLTRDKQDLIIENRALRSLLVN